MTLTRQFAFITLPLLALLQTASAQYASAESNGGAVFNADNGF